MDSSVSATKPAPPALPSPRAAPVFLSDSFEELLRFTLSASLVQDSEVSLGFSHEYCENLLRDDPFSSSSHISTIAVGGVPEYPLYKNLARALESCIKSGKFFRDLCSVKGLREDESFRLKQKEFDRLIAEKGAELVNIMENVEFELHVQEPFFSQLKEGLKTAVGRCATEDYNRISAGALLLFNRCLLLEVQDVRRYGSFSEMLEVELANALPGIQSVEEGVQIYRNFYTEEKEKSNGALAIHVLKAASQPYISLGILLLAQLVHILSHLQVEEILAAFQHRLYLRGLNQDWGACLSNCLQDVLVSVVKLCDRKKSFNLLVYMTQVGLQLSLKVLPLLMLQDHWPSILTGAVKDGGAAFVEVILKRIGLLWRLSTVC